MRQAPATTNHAPDVRDVAGAPKWMVGVITRLTARKLTLDEHTLLFTSEATCGSCSSHRMVPGC